MKTSPRDAEIGRSLAETAALNEPARLAGLDAAESVRRSAHRPDRQRAHRRRFRLALLVLVGGIAALAGLLAILT